MSRQPGPRIYLDHNATAPLLPEALEAMMPFLREGAANPSSTHHEGQRARLAIEEAREEVAGLAGCRPSEVVFTSGGTESNNAALVGAVMAALPEGARTFPEGANVVSTTLEHPSVYRGLRGLEVRGLEVRRVAPDAGGMIDARRVATALDSHTVLVSVMHVNNEIGTVQPIFELAEICAARGIGFHSDAVQSLGKIPIPANGPLVSLSAHKLGGPHGVGALIVRGGARLEPWLRGGPQETRRRAGTENVAGIVGFGAAARAARSRQDRYEDTMGRLRARLESELAGRFPGLIVHGATATRVANTSSFSIPLADGNSLQVALDLEGFAVSNGTACASGKTAPSYVLRAIGASEDASRAALRVSFGWENTLEDVERFVDALVRIAARSGLDVANPVAVQASPRGLEPASPRLGANARSDR